MSSNDRIAQTVSEIVEPIAVSMGLDLVHVEYLLEQGGWILRFLVDRQEGVTIGECRSLSREISCVLDVEDLVPSRYRLEVSSPGLDRPLVKRDDYEKFSGREVELKTEKPIDGRRKFKGILIGLDGDNVVLEFDGQKHQMDFSNIAKANLVPDFEDLFSRAGK